MTNWKGFERKWSWPVWRYYPSILIRKNWGVPRKTWARIVVLAHILTDHLPNTSRKRHGLTQLARFRIISCTPMATLSHKKRWFCLMTSLPRISLHRRDLQMLRVNWLTGVRVGRALEGKWMHIQAVNVLSVHYIKVMFFHPFGANA
jgi:hypothetical protein